MFKKIKQIIVEQSVCDEEDIKLEAEIDDLKLDSLDKIELLMALEEEFNVQISDEKAELVKTVKTIKNGGTKKWELKVCFLTK